jgi:hypothetical protein
LYTNVPKSLQKPHRHSSKIIWNHPAEVHVKDGKVTEEHWKWREKGYTNADPVRYPVGIQHNGQNILGMLVFDPEGQSTAPSADQLTLPKGWVLHDYVHARKQYFAMYRQLVRAHPVFVALKKRLQKGENLLIIEVDGPIQKDLSYYRETYDVGHDFIENHTMLMNTANLQIMFHDTKNRCGHGYALAAELLDLATP